MNEKRLYHLTDHLDSTTVTTDSARNIVEQTEYSPYGTESVTNGPNGSTENPLPEQRKYIGQEYDSSTGLNYLNARYYNSTLGRFTTQDPVFWEVGNTERGYKVLQDPQQMNSYSYARNNPIKYSDPNGESIDMALFYWYELMAHGLKANSLLKDAINNQNVYTTEHKNVLIQQADYHNEQVSVYYNKVVAELQDSKDNIIRETVMKGLGSIRYLGKLLKVAKNSANVQKQKFKEPKSGISGKEGAKDVPSWSRGNKPYQGENGDQFARRLLDQKYGKGNYETKSHTEYAQIKKWGDRSFQ